MQENGATSIGDAFHTAFGVPKPAVGVVVGSFLKVDLVWNLSDLFNALMVFPNLIALLALSGVVARESRGERLR